jgi:hypothetical protein
MLKAGEFRVDKITTDDFKVRQYSGAAVITGRSCYHSGGTTIWQVRHPQIWANPSGRWRLVGWQGTSVATEA